MLNRIPLCLTLFAQEVRAGERALSAGNLAGPKPGDERWDERQDAAESQPGRAETCGVRRCGQARQGAALRAAEVGAAADGSGA